MKTTITRTISILTLVYLFTVTNVFALSITCPTDQWVSCTDELWDLTIYGNATYEDYNGTHDAGPPVDEYFLNMCDIGYITRTWTVQAYGHTATCTQTIYAQNNNPFNYNNINWPLSGLELEGCNPNTNPEDLPAGYGAPTYNYSECAMIAVNHNDEIFTISATCKKLLRTWQVMDWCTYNEYTGQGGLWSFTQVIKLIDATVPEPIVPKDSTYHSYNCQDAYINIPTLIVDPTACGGAFNVTNNSPHADTTTANASGTYPIGTTTIKYTVRYACGKKKYYTTKVTIMDSKKPQPYCYQALSVAMMPIDNDGDGIPEDGMVQVWAKDLDYDSYHNCPSHYPLRFSFSEDPTDMVKTFTCAEVGENTLNMWVTDKFNNQSYCKIILDVQNNIANIPDCEPEELFQLVSAAGYIQTASREYVKDTEVKLSPMPAEEEEEPIIEEPLLSLSAEDGFYNFDSLDMHHDYMLSCAKEIDLHQYVTKEDVRALYLHINGREVITDPLLLIAADIDDDQIVDRKDLYAMYYFAYGIKDDLGAKKTHFFMPNYYTIKDVSSYYNDEIEESFTIHDLSKPMQDIGFKMVVKGDLYSINVNHHLRNGWDRNLDLEIADYLLNTRIIKNNSIISPNPFVDQLNIELKYLPKSDITISFYNNQAKKLNSYSYPPNKMINIKLSDPLNPGIYYYELIYDDVIESGKVIKL